MACKHGYRQEPKTWKDHPERRQEPKGAPTWDRFPPTLPQGQPKNSGREGITILDAFRRDPSGRLMERLQGGLASFRMVSEERWGPPGSSLSSLGALWESPWGAVGTQRPLPFALKNLVFYNVLSMLMIPGTRGSVTTPPSHFIMYTSTTRSGSCVMQISDRPSK